MNRSSIGICMLLLLSLATPGARANSIQQGLVPVENSRLERAYARPEVDWAGYKRVLVAALDVSNIEVVQPRNDAGTRRLTFELNDVDRQLLQALYAETMNRRVFDEGGFEEARLPGPDILMLRIAITQVAPTAPRDTHDGRPSNTAFVTEGAGAISINGILQDGETGEWLAYFEDTRDGSSFFRKNTPTENRRQIRDVFDAWAKLFVRQLGEVMDRGPE